MDWTVLGIKETKDKKAITAAYREKLKVTNPEDDQEKFMRLRAAYEEALKLADAQEQPKGDSPVDVWMSKVEAVYKNFKQRLSPDTWKELVSDDVCISIDKKPFAEKALLEFFLDNYYLPKNIWEIIDGCFRFTERKEELYESFPKDFVDYAVIDGIKFGPSLPCELFIPGENASDCDDYRTLYFRANKSFGEEFEQILAQMDELSEKHPYGEVLRNSYKYNSEDAAQKEEGKAGLFKLAEDYPDVPSICLTGADLYLNDNDPDKASEIIEHVLSLFPDNYRAKKMKALCLAAKGEYDPAKEIVYRLYDIIAGDQREADALSALLKEWNEKLIEGREKRFLEAPEDGENAIELGWCYLQNDRGKDALELCKKIDPNVSNQFQYHNLYSKVLYNEQDYENAAEHFQTAAEISKNTQPDGTEETDRIIAKRPELLQLYGSCLSQMHKDEEAMKVFEEAFALAPDNQSVILNMIFTLASTKNYERTIELSNKLLEIHPDNYQATYYLAYALYKLRRDRDAFENINRALNIDPGQFWAYILKLRILERNGVWEEIKEILAFLRQNGIEDPAPVLYFDGVIEECLNNNKEAALEIYKKVADKIEEGEVFEWVADVYFNIALLTDNVSKKEAEDKRSEILEFLNKGLEKDPDDIGCLDYKAWILKNQKKYDEALDLYKKLETMPGHKANTERNIADIYYSNLSVNAEKALEYYKKVPEYDDSAELLFYIGTCYRYLYDFKNAEDTFLKMQKTDPSDVDGWRGLSFVYESENRFEEALEQAETVLKMNKEKDKKDDQPIYHKIRLLRRLNRPNDAIEEVNELIDFKDSTPFALKYEIMAQFGQWDRIKDYLKTWKSLKKEPQACTKSEIQYLILTGNTGKAKGQLFFENGLTEYQKDSLTIDIAELEMNYKNLEKIWLKRLKQTPDDTRALLNLAEDYYHWGKKDKASEYVQKALELLPDEISAHHSYEAMYRTRYAFALALAGAPVKAAEELEHSRSLPLCENCDYCACKDADVYEASIAELTGDYEKAEKLCKKGIKNWPDEIDFQIILNRLKKGKKI